MEEYLLFLGILLIIIICFILYYNNNKKNIIDNVVTTIKDTFSQKIPKIIIQTWKNNEIPTKYLPLSKILIRIMNISFLQIKISKYF